MLAWEVGDSDAVLLKLIAEGIELRIAARHFQVSVPHLTSISNHTTSSRSLCVPVIVAKSWSEPAPQFAMLLANSDTWEVAITQYLLPRFMGEGPTGFEG